MISYRSFHLVQGQFDVKGFLHVSNIYSMLPIRNVVVIPNLSRNPNLNNPRNSNVWKLPSVFLAAPEQPQIAISTHDFQSRHKSDSSTSSK